MESFPLLDEDSLSAGSGYRRPWTAPNFVGVSKKGVYTRYPPRSAHHKVCVFSDSMLRTAAHGAVDVDKRWQVVSVPGARFSHLTQEITDMTVASSAVCEAVVMGPMSATISTCLPFLDTSQSFWQRWVSLPTVPLL